MTVQSPTKILDWIPPPNSTYQSFVAREKSPLCQPNLTDVEKSMEVSLLYTDTRKIGKWNSTETTDTCARRSTRVHMHSQCLQYPWSRVQYKLISQSGRSIWYTAVAEQFKMKQTGSNTLRIVYSDSVHCLNTNTETCEKIEKIYRNQWLFL